MASTRFRVQEHIVPAQHIREFPGATRGSQEEVLRLHCKQYIPLGSSEPGPDAVTIIATHANGFPKEVYEPLWEEIYERSRGKFNIRSIWMADVTHQGQSYVLNEDTVSNEPSWFDHSRDLLHMVNLFRDEMPRPIVGIGHSWGGTQLINLSLMHPRLFTGLILLDPVIELGPTTRGGNEQDGDFSIATASTHRRDLWPSRQEASAAFDKSLFYKRWDQRVFDQFIQHGLRQLPTVIHPNKQPAGENEHAVTLTTPKHQEVWTYLRPNFQGRDENGNEVFNRELTPDISPGSSYTYPFYRAESAATFHRLPFVRPDVLYILGKQSNVSTPDVQRDKVKMTGIGVGGSGGLSEGRVKDVTLNGIGHLVPMEAPDATAQISVNWLGDVLHQWRKQEQRFQERREAMTAREHLELSEEWIQRIGNKPGRKDRISGTKL